MSWLRKINVFWLGAGALLFLFNTNEIVAHHMVRVPRWLGGPVIYAGAVVGALLGVLVMAFLGVRPEVEPESSASAPALSPDEAREGNHEPQSN